jgi:predicted N-acyltransferase
MNELVRRISTHYRRRRELRRPTRFHFAIADRIDSLDGERWDLLAEPASFFLQRPYLRMLERAGPVNLEPRYGLISDDDGPVAAVAMQIVSLTPDRLRKLPANEPRRLLKALSRPAEKLKEAARQRVLVCGNLLTYGFHAAAFAPDRDPDCLWPAVGEVLYRVRRAEKLSGQTNFVLVKDLGSGEMAQSSALGGLSYRAVETEPNMVLRLPPGWRSYDDYLQSLSSKYKSSLKQQILKPIAAAGCTVERLGEIDGHADRLHALYLEVHENAAIRPVTLPPPYFAALAEAAGERFRCTILRRQEKVLGFIASLRDADCVFAYHIGFDREAAKELPLYLRLLHLAIADAIELGGRRISFGRTALEPKARLGCKPEPMSVWMRHRQPVVNSLIRRLLTGIEHEEAPERNPFKTGAAADV